MAAAAFDAVAFDLDGTLLRGTSVAIVLADAIGHGEEMAELERRYAAGEIGNDVIAARHAEWMTPYDAELVERALRDAPWIDGITETVEALHRDGAVVLLATITWRFAADLVAAWHGFDGACGTDLLPGGRVRVLDEDGKAAVIVAECARRGIALDRLAAVGDSRSDLPLFARAGHAIALNGDERARAAADARVDTGDLRDLLPALQAGRVAQLVRRTPHLMTALRAAREVAAPDWLLGAGAVRGAVWDHLHGTDPRPPNDLDLVFFDDDDHSAERDAAVEAALSERLPGVAWDAKNQAAVHSRYAERFGERVERLRSTADGVATWPEIATCVAVRLEADDRLTVVAPYGLDDLLGLRWRHNPRRVTREMYAQRLAEKDPASRWPRVTVEPA